MLTINKRTVLSRARIAIAGQPIVQIDRQTPAIVPEGFLGKYYVLPLCCRGGDTLSGLDLNSPIKIVRDGPVIPQIFLPGESSASFIRVDGEYAMKVGGRIPRMLFWRPLPTASSGHQLSWTLRGRIPASIPIVDAAPMFLLVPVQCTEVIEFDGSVAQARGTWDVEPPMSYPTLGMGEGLRFESIPINAECEDVEESYNLLATGEFLPKTDGLYFHGFVSVKGPSTASEVELLLERPRLYTPSLVEALVERFESGDAVVPVAPTPISGGGSAPVKAPEVTLKDGAKLYADTRIAYGRAAAYGGVLIDDGSETHILAQADLPGFRRWLESHPGQVSWGLTGDRLDAQVVALDGATAIIPLGTSGVATAGLITILSDTGSPAYPSIDMVLAMHAINPDINVGIRVVRNGGDLAAASVQVCLAYHMSGGSPDSQTPLSEASNLTASGAWYVTTFSQSVEKQLARAAAVGAVVLTMGNNSNKPINPAMLLEGEAGSSGTGFYLATRVAQNGLLIQVFLGGDAADFRFVVGVKNPA